MITLNIQLNLRVWDCGSVTVQSAFCLEIHQNKIFYFLKIIFDIITSKQSENIKKLFQKKIQNF
jgi:hypothetical protein